MIVHQLNHSLARSLTRSLVRRGMRGDRGVARPPRQGEERREKRGERRTNTEERGGRREERREKTEDRRAAQSADDPKAEEPKIALSGFHRPAASARCAAIPTWLRRWAVGALGARPDAYTLRRIAGALVLHNGLCHAHKRGHCAVGTLLHFLSRSMSE